MVITPPFKDFFDGNEGKTCQDVNVWIAIPVNFYNAQIVKPFETLYLPEIVPKTLEKPRDPRVDISPCILELYITLECESDKDVLALWKLDMLKPRVIPLVERPKVGNTDGKLTLFFVDENR
jgi:hypothetical protein